MNAKHLMRTFRSPGRQRGLPAVVPAATHQKTSRAWCISHLFTAVCGLALLIGALPALANPEPDEPWTNSSINWDLPIEAIPDLREIEEPMVVPSKRTKSYFIVPVPMSSPTFGTGLALGGAYFYPQSDAQKAAQPASFTGAAAGYTSNDSWAGGIMQQSYWDEDRWRFNAVAGYADFRLELVQSLNNPDESVVDWVVSGSFIQSSIARRLGDNWYLGGTLRYLDISQGVDLNIDIPDYSLEPSIVAPGVGVYSEYDTRDIPSNAFSGTLAEFKAMVSDQRSRDNGTYIAMSARIRRYHQLRDDFVLAWDINGCQKSGEIPLWDTCRLNLRGFPVTDYLSKQSIAAQVEGRWQFSERWGAVAFAGAGLVDRPFADNGDGETIPSYGVGLRYMVLPSQRINIRVDYGRSDTGTGAWYLSVGEAF